MTNQFAAFKNLKEYIKRDYLYLGVLILLIAVAVSVSSSFSKDSVGYNWMFNKYGASGWSALSFEMFQREMFFLLVTKIVHQFGLGATYVFLIYAVISLPIKFYLIDKYSKDRFLSLAYFCSYFFILHDCTQLRFGMAVAFAYFGLQYLLDNRKLVFCGIIMLSAILFHYAILVFLLMILFTSRRSLSWLLVMVCLAIALYPLNLNAILLDIVTWLINYFGIEGTAFNKLHDYLWKPRSDLHLGIFSRHGLLIYFFGIIIFKYRNSFSKYELLCYNAFILSVFFWILMKDTMVLQVRFNDVFGFSLVFLMPYAHKFFSEYVGEKKAYIILILFFTAYLAKFILHDKMVVF